MVYSGPIRGYKSAVQYLYSHADYERYSPAKYTRRNFNLDRMQHLLSKLDNPQHRYRCVHIAGTKGKGSTATMLARMLQACGYKVGLYISPHINCLRERITINEQKISQKKLTTSIANLASHVDKMGKEKPTFFEIMTAVAFRHFSESAVDIAVVESGLGGRLDSTNVLEPSVCGITSISIDHTQQLGQNIAEIAREKAGILKKGVPAVSVPQHPEAATALRQIASEVNTNIFFTGEDIDFSYRVESSRTRGCHTRLSLTTARSQFEHLPVPLPGEHQALNCGLALALLDQLKAQGVDIDDERAISGLSTTELSGRMEMICHEPRILIDGAHNAASVKALVRSIGQHIHYDSMIMIVGCSADKDLHGIMQQVATGADKVIFTCARNTPRAAEPRMLAEIYTELSDGKTGQVAENLEDALRIADIAASPEDLICVCGSFYLIGQAKELVGKLVKQV